MIAPNLPAPQSRQRLLAVALLALLASPATAQNQDPDAVRKAQEAARQAELRSLQLRVQAEAAPMQVQAQQAQIQILQAQQAQIQILGQKVAVLNGGMIAGQGNMTDDQFEQWVYAQVGSAADAHHRLETSLSLLVEDVDRSCKLSDEQKSKMRLTGRGDIRRLFDTVDTVKDKFRALNNDVNGLQDVMPDITAFRSALTGYPFHDESMLAKSMRHTLTSEQFERYDTVMRERRTAQHRANVQRAVAIIEQGAPLGFEQRRDLINLLASETKPPRKQSQYDLYVVIHQIGDLPDEKLRPLLDGVQWQSLKRVVDQYRSMEPTLRAQGLLPERDEGAVKK